jgi:phosphopentomutase
MSEIKFKMTGIKEQQQALSQLVPDLVRETEPMMRALAEATVSTIRGLYTYGEGSLVKGMQTRPLLKGSVIVSHVVENIAPLARIYDHGTQTVRETKQGYSRGRMPARPVFTRTTNDMQREATQKTMDILRRHGLTVTYADT